MPVTPPLHSLAPLGIVIVAVGSLLFAALAWGLTRVMRRRSAADVGGALLPARPSRRAIWCAGAGLCFACVWALPSAMWQLATAVALLGAAQLATGLGTPSRFSVCAADDSEPPPPRRHFTLRWCLRFFLGLSAALSLVGWKVQSSTSTQARQQVAIHELSQRGGSYQQGHVQWAGANIRDGDLWLLKQLPTVTHLELGNTGVTNQGLLAVAELPSLRELSLRGTAITDEGLSHLGKCRALSRLSLRGTAVTASGLAALQHLPLEHLDLSLCPVSRPGLTELTKLPLVHLSLMQTKLGDADLDLLLKIPAHILEISDTHLSPRSIQTLRARDAHQRLIVR